MNMCVPYESSPKDGLVEKDFSIQVDRITQSVDTSQSVFPATTVITQKAHEKNGHGGRDRHYAWVQQYDLPLTRDNLAVAPVYCPVFQQQTPTLSP